ncbi:MAG: hypothetical protein ABI346_03605 [Candidatus Baltobacteraceae bacterium]
MFASTIVVNAFNYVYHFVMSRRLGVVDYGALASIFAGLVIASVPAAILTMVAVKYAAEFNAAGDRARLRALGLRVLQVTAVFGVAALLATIAFAGPLARYLNIAEPRAIAAGGAALAVGLITPVLRGVVQGAQDFRRLAISTALEAASKLLFGLGFVFAGFGLVGAILGYAVGSLVSLIYTIIVVRGYASVPAPRLSIDLRRLSATTRGIAFATFAFTSLSFADVVLVKHFFSPHLAGLYGAISLVGKVLLFVVGFVPTIVLPKATTRAANGEPPLPILLQAGSAIVVLLGLGLGALYVAPALALRVMAGSAFVGAASYVFPYGVAMTLLAATGMVMSYKVGLHRFDFVVPLGFAAIGEIVAIQFVHARIDQVINVLIIGHAFALVGTLYAVHRPVALGREYTVTSAREVA